ncbi:BFR2 [Candida margitis]|uniref:BFR2 n=1 Tax=Candida margitis TaxID=1775924 RepID=UPI002225D0C4|nr:BFR2 [Candida margitis]KAI5963952.1 BFR2 [Candida margitis]
MAKKTLADEISSFYEPKSEFDIEDFDNGPSGKDVFQHKENDSSEEELSDEELKKDHYVASSKSKLRDQQGPRLGKKYTGDVVSRDDLYNSSQGSEDDEGEHQVSSSDESDGIDNDEEIENEDSEDSEDSEGSEEESLESDSNRSEEPESDEETERKQSSDTPMHQKSLVRQLLNKEKSHLVNRLSQSAINDTLKGYAVKQQYKTYEKIVDVRIKFQKAANSANQLPIDASTYNEYKSEDSDGLVKDAKQALYGLLTNILLLRSQLGNTDAAPPKKRSFEAMSNAIQTADNNLTSQRASILNKWSYKVQNSSGNSAMNANKFKTINQSFEQQVKNNLSDMERLIKRTKLNRKQVVPLGYSKEEKVSAAPQNDDEVDEEIVPRKKAQGQQNPYIFDDEDFYRVLLNDLVDKKVQSSDPTSNITIIRSAQKANKLKNNVDTKASKGRKLKFHVQEQIANFETSIGGWKWSDDQIDEFFASLLGQKVNMNEDEAEDKEESDNEIEAESNGIRLFG